MGPLDVLSPQGLGICGEALRKELCLRAGDEPAPPVVRHLVSDELAVEGLRECPFLKHDEGLVPVPSAVQVRDLRQCELVEWVGPVKAFQQCEAVGGLADELGAAFPMLREEVGLDGNAPGTVLMEFVQGRAETDADDRMGDLPGSPVF